MVQPDILVICDRENIDEKGRYHGVPTLVVEILSGSSKRIDFLKKLDLYMTAGVKEYWIVNPDSKVVYVYSLKDNNIESINIFKGDGYGSRSILTDSGWTLQLFLVRAPWLILRKIMGEYDLATDNNRAVCIWKIYQRKGNIPEKRKI